MLNKNAEQTQTICLELIDPTKSFDPVVNRPDLFTLLIKVCPTKRLQRMISFYEDIRGNVHFYGSSSHPFHVVNGVKQGCRYASTLLDIVVSILFNINPILIYQGITIHC